MGDQSRHSGMPYDSPFATQGRMWTPMQVRYLMNTCKFYYLMNPLINAATTKMAMYPITEIIVQDADKEVRHFYEDYFTNSMDLHTHLIEAGLDYNVYGNMFSSIMFPFIKYLECKRCGHKVQAKSTRFDYSGGAFSLNCKKCGNYGEANAEDVYIKNPQGIRIVRWNPADFQISHNEVTGDTIYRWTMPSLLRHDIVVGKHSVVSKTPQDFLASVRDNEPLLFNENRLFHMKRPSISSKTLGRAWGVPMILPVIEDVYYLQVLRKAQEQIASEHLVPLRVLFPQGTSQGDAPYTMMNLTDWKDQIQEELTKYRRDRNYIPVLPVPVGNQTIAGEGRALLLHQEIRAVNEQIVAGMGVPVEFVFGGLSYSGTSVSMRMLENVMLNYRQEHLRYMRWIVQQVSGYMGWPSSTLKLRDFRMADDLNRRQYLFNLWQSGLISDQALLEESGFDAAEERENRQNEEKAKFDEQERSLLAQTEAQNKATRLQTLAQRDIQMEMQEETGMPAEEQMPQASGEMMQDQAGSDLTQDSMTPEAEADGNNIQVNLLQYAQQVSSRLMTLEPQARAAALAQVRMEQPAMAAEVVRIMKENSPGEVRNLPEQLPPRRGPETSVI